MTPTTLHPSVVRHRSAAQPTPASTQDVPLATAPAHGAPFVAGPGSSGSGSADPDATYGGAGPRVPFWLVALVVGAFLAIVTGALAGALYGPGPDGRGAVTGIATTEEPRPTALPTGSATASGLAGATTGGAAGTGTTSHSGAAGSGAGSGGGSSGGSAGTGATSDTGAGTGTDAGSTGTGAPDPGPSTPAADPGEFSIVSPGSGTRLAGKPITLKVTAVLPDGGGAVPDADIHWRLTRSPGGTVVYEHDGSTAVVPGGLVAAGTYTATVHVDSGGLVGSRHVSFAVVAGPTLTLAPAVTAVTLAPSVVDPAGGRVVPVVDPKP
jgi:hypothetical protein